MSNVELRISNIEGGRREGWSGRLMDEGDPGLNVECRMSNVEGGCREAWSRGPEAMVSARHLLVATDELRSVERMIFH